jgi:predicted TIM-barrel fold metal-dependent hydrolase
MMIIDSHTHIFPKDYRLSHEQLLISDATYADLFQKSAPPSDVESLIQSMDESNINKSVTLGMGWTDIELASDMNDYLIDSSNKYPGRLIPFCSINPKWGDKALYELERCFKNGAKGVGEIHPDTQNIDLTSSVEFTPIMQFCEEYDLPVVLHSSEPLGHSYSGKGKTYPSKIIEFIRNFQNNIIICAHFGGGLPFYALMPEIKAILSKVYFDSAATPYLYSSDVYKTVESLVGSRQILFGSDYPVVKHHRSLEHLMNAELDSDTLMTVTYTNINDILNT